MNRTLRAVLLVAVMFCPSTALLAEPPDVILLSKPDAFGSPSRAPVRFTHGHHASPRGADCLTCHHHASLTQGSTPIRCETCHATPASLEQAFHGQCITCHDAETKSGRATGPRACGECHAWSR
jgi:LSD1 subclass zinc finger protein